MKTKSIVLLGAAALVTLSFTFASVNKGNQTQTNKQAQTSNAPVGGFASEEIVK